MLQKRATTVLNEIHKVAGQMEACNVHLAQLLCEVRDNQYYKTYGFKSFWTWFDALELTVKRRFMDHWMRIVRKSTQAGISAVQLQQVNFSKLREIFTLNPTKNRADIHRLMRVANTANLDAITGAVVAINGNRTKAFAAYSVCITEQGRELIEKAVSRAMRDGATTKGEALFKICQQYLRQARSGLRRVA